MPAGLRELQEIFGGGFIGALLGSLVLAVITLFVLLVRSWTARARQSARYYAAAEKFRELSQRMLEAFEDETAVRAQRKERRARTAATKTGEYPVPTKPTGGGT